MLRLDKLLAELGTDCVKSAVMKWSIGVTGCVVLSLLGTSGCIPASSEMNASDAPAELPAPTTPLQEQISPDENLLLPQGQILPVTAQVEINGQQIGLEVAATPQQQAIGLMARETLPDDRGMLFPFEPPRPVNFWMKNVLIPLDMVFIRRDRVVAIAADVPICTGDPCPTYGPENQAVDHVLELRGGLAAELGLEVGDTLEVEWLEPES